jgi:hypothetical protein
MVETANAANVRCNLPPKPNLYIRYSYQLSDFSLVVYCHAVPDFQPTLQLSSSGLVLIKMAIAVCAETFKQLQQAIGPNS